MPANPSAEVSHRRLFANLSDFKVDLVDGLGSVNYN
jgi:hypothetical protein